MGKGVDSTSAGGRLAGTGLVGSGAVVGRGVDVGWMVGVAVGLVMPGMAKLHDTLLNSMSKASAEKSLNPRRPLGAERFDIRDFPFA